MTRDQAIRKVLACLRLSKSSNVNEAAAAMRQAQAMMDKYGLTDADALASEINSADASTRANGALLTRSVAGLANLVASGYRCEVICRQARGFDRNFNIRGRTVVSFFGAGADPQVAAYAFTVLRRQLETEKARHTRRIRKRANKIARAESFAIGWVAAVAQLFPAAELPDGRKAAINRAVALRCGATEESAARDLITKAARDSDLAAGYIAGKSARVNPGLNESGQPRLEHTP